MKVRATCEGLAVPATVVTANLPKDTIVSITANKTVDRAGANAFPVGRLVAPAKSANGSGTIETPFKELIEIKASGSITANDFVKLAAVDGTTSENRVSTWVDGTDSVKRIFGVAWKGGADGATVEVLVF